MERESNNSYRFETLPNRDSERTRLLTRATWRLDGFVPLLQSHGMRDGMVVLDVACGHGVRTRLIAENFPHSKVTGVDLSEDLISDARAFVAESTARDRVCFETGDAHLLNYPNASFDFIYTRLFMMHLAKPMSVLKELHRVLKPGGVILIEDADRDFMKFYPTPKGWRGYWNDVMDAQCRLGGDPNVGTKLSSYLKSTNFVSVKTELQPYVFEGDFTQNVAVELLYNLNEYCEEPVKSRGKKLIDELIELSKQPEAMFYHIWCVVSGRKEVN